MVPATAVVVAAGLLALGASGRRPPAPALRTVVVRPGQTLWGLAVTHAPAGDDPRPWIFATERLNGLAGAGLVPGQVLHLPAHSR